MSRTITIAQRELSSMFRVPAGWIIIALFAFLTGVLFVNQTIIPGLPGSLRYFFAYSGWLLIPIAPAISMRLMSEEYRSGSFEALRTAPAGDWSVTLGKYLGSLGFLILMLVPTLIYPIVLMLVSNPSPDLGPIVAGYLMLVLVGMLYLGIGMVASSLTTSQTLAFLGTVMTLILLMVLTSIIAKQASVETGIILSMLSITDRVNELSKGIIDTSAIAFFVIGSIWMLVLASGVLEVRRLGRSRPFTIITVSVFIVATSIAVLFAGFITTTYHYRVDVTSTGAHKLSQRATGIVDRLTDPTEIVLAIGMNRADRRSVDLVSDVLDAYDRSSDLLSVRVIDLDSPEGIEHTKSLLSNLASRDQSIIDTNMSALRHCAEILEEIPPQLSSIATALEAVRDAIKPTTQRDANNRGVFEQRAQLFRLYARDTGAQAESINTQLESQSHSPTKPSDIFPFDSFAEPVERSLAQLMNQLDDLASQITLFVEDQPETESASIASPMIRALESLRDRSAIAHDRITRIERIDALAVGRALETGEALLVIGAPDQGVAAVDLDALLPSTIALERAGISAAGVIGPRAQELIATALAQLVAPVQPILIFVHGGKPNELLAESKLFTQTVEKLGAKGIDTLEWAAVEEPTPPDLDLLDPLGNRPIVFALISVDSSAGSGDSGLTGAKRATAIGAVLARLIDEGESVLVSLSPSVFPTSGLDDPLAQAFASLGIIPDSGRPLLHDKIAALGRVADPITVLVPTESSDDHHPIANAMSGLSTVIPWAIPLTIEQITDVESFPIIELASEGEKNQTWAERDWLGLWQTPAQSRSLARNQPIYNADTDVQSENWVLAAGAQRTHAGTRQRIIVVGSNGWSTDSITANNEQLVDGRITTKWPGNMTLLDSSIVWLAGMDDLIGPGTQARPIATIKNLDPKQRSMIRWLLLAGLPGLILIMGMVFRLIFG